MQKKKKRSSCSSQQNHRKTTEKTTNGGTELCLHNGSCHCLHSQLNKNTKPPLPAYFSCFQASGFLLILEEKQLCRRGQ